MQIIKTALLVVVALLCQSLALADDDQLTVTQDESTMERTIARYLSANYSVEAREVALSEDDLALAVTMDGKGRADFDVNVDTEPSARNEDHSVVLERVITVQVFTGVRVPEDKRRGVLEAINRFTAGNWFAAIYIDEDDEVACQWSVNVMKQGLPTDYAADAIVRLADTWRRLRADVQAELEGEG